MNKTFWFDVETTGTDPEKHDIVKLAGIVEIDGNIKERISFQCRPVEGREISEEALKIHGCTKDEIIEWKPPAFAHQKLISLFGRYVDKYVSTDKFMPAGYNVPFDVNFLASFFRLRGDMYFGSWFHGTAYDVRGMAAIAVIHGKMPPPLNYKLSTLCEMFKISIEAHDPMSDIRATKELGAVLMGRILALPESIQQALNSGDGSYRP